MTEPLNYPLQQLMLIKQKRFDEAIKILEQKKKILEKEFEKLFEVTKQRDQVRDHKVAKLNQLRAGLDEGISTDKIHQMKIYLKTVDEKLAEKEKKVILQQKEVDAAQKQVTLATNEMLQKKKDLEKLEIHKGEWEKEAHYWSLRKEETAQDEQGSSMHEIRKKASRKRAES